MRASLAAKAVVYLSLASFLGCFEGGANFHGQSAGNNDRGGVDLAGSRDSVWDDTSATGGDHEGFGELAVDPEGRWFLSRVGPQLVVGDVAAGTTAVVEGVSRPSRLAFAWRAPRFYVTSETSRAVAAYDARTRARLWSWEHAACSYDVRLYPSRDDRVLVLACFDAVFLLDAATGSERARHDTAHEQAIEDVDVTPDSLFALVTLDERWGQSEGSPSTAIEFLDLASGRVVDTVHVPNCSAPLVLAPDGARGFLAPTRCGRDPISVVDVHQRRFVRNLPGFGPVAMARDGNTAVGFLDTWAMDESLFREGDPRPTGAAAYHVMLIDTRSLAFRLVPIGDELPRYDLTPDGNVLLVDWDSWWSDEGDGQRIRLLDVPTGELRTVAGSAVQLDHYTLHPNSRDVYLLSEASLYWLSTPALRVTPVSVTGHWRSLNLTPDGRNLLLLDFSDRLTVYDLGTRSIRHTIDPPWAPADDDFDWGTGG